MFPQSLRRTCMELTRSNSVTLSWAEALEFLDGSDFRLHLLAPYSRMAAMVGPYVKEVPNLLLSWLQQELEQARPILKQNGGHGKKRCIEQDCSSDTNLNPLDIQLDLVWLHVGDGHSHRVAPWLKPWVSFSVLSLLALRDDDSCTYVFAIVMPLYIPYMKHGGKLM